MSEYTNYIITKIEKFLNNKNSSIVSIIQTFRCPLSKLFEMFAVIRELVSLILCIIYEAAQDIRIGL